MKKIAFILSCVMIMVLLVPAIAVSADELPTPISTADEFIAMSGVPGNYQLTGDIDFAGRVFERCILENFDGTLDGDGHKLYNFSINYTEASADAGMILRLGQNSDSTVKNLNIGTADAPIAYSFINNNKSMSPFVAVTGNNDPGTNVVIENVHIFADADVIYADASHKGNAAGFVAYACKKGTLTFTNCSYNGTFDSGIDNEGTAYRNAGAFISAANTPTIVFTDCVNNAPINQGISSVEARAAGFIPYVAPGISITFTNCVNNGAVTVMGTDSDAYAAGFVSHARGPITFTGCKNNGAITGNWYTGGFISHVEVPGSSLTDCESNGAIGEAICYSATVGFVPTGSELTITNLKNTTTAPDIYAEEVEATEEETTSDVTEDETTKDETTKDETPDETPSADTTKNEAPVDTTVETPEKGCGSVIAGSAVIVAILGAALVIKKRD